MAVEDKASSFNGRCMHMFEATDRGLVCKECGYSLPLVEISENKG